MKNLLCALGMIVGSTLLLVVVLPFAIFKEIKRKKK